MVFTELYQLTTWEHRIAPSGCGEPRSMPPAAPVVSFASDTDPTGETLAINLSGELALAMRGNFEKLADSAQQLLKVTFQFVFNFSLTLFSHLRVTF